MLQADLPLNCHRTLGKFLTVAESSVQPHLFMHLMEQGLCRSLKPIYIHIFLQDSVSSREIRLKERTVRVLRGDPCE